MPIDDLDRVRTQAAQVGDPPTEVAPLGPLGEDRGGGFSRRDVLRAARAVTGTGLGAGVLSACGGGSPKASAASSGSRTLRLSSVVTVGDGGLWSDLLPTFTRQTGIGVDLRARMDVFTPARTGTADIVYSHYGHKDLHGFVMGGYGLWPRTVLFNLVCLLGPARDPAGVRGLGDLGEAFARIAKSRASFEVNNIPELVYLTEVVLGAARVSKGGWYVNHGLSKADAVTRASSRGAYTMWGVTPFLDLAATKHLNLEPLVIDDPILQRIMVTIIVNPSKVSGVNTRAANAFQRYLLSPETQSRVRAFHSKALGRPIFFPGGATTRPLSCSGMKPAAAPVRERGRETVTADMAEGSLVLLTTY